jgi:hypothetical protein
LHVWERSACRGWWLNLEERNYLENLGVDGMTISLEIRWEGVDWIYLARDRGLIQVKGSCEQGMNPRFPSNAENLLVN